MTVLKKEEKALGVITREKKFSLLLKKKKTMKIVFKVLRTKLFQKRNLHALLSQQAWYDKVIFLNNIYMIDIFSRTCNQNRTELCTFSKSA